MELFKMPWNMMMCCLKCFIVIFWGYYEISKNTLDTPTHLALIILLPPPTPLSRLYNSTSTNMTSNWQIAVNAVSKNATNK